MKQIGLKSILKRKFIDASISLLQPHPAVTLSPKSSVKEALVLMEKRKVGSIVVQPPGQPAAGIFTERDVLKSFISEKKKFLISPLSSSMSSPLQTLSIRASVARALYSMSIGGFRHLGISGAHDELLMISIKDILDFLYRTLTKKIVLEEHHTYFDENSVDQFFLSPVSTLKPKEPLWVSESMTIFEAVTLMNQHKVGCLLVGDSSQKLVGIFTEKDFVVFAPEVTSTIDTVTVSACMTTSPKTAKENSSVAHVLNLMCENGFRHIPIVREDESLVGILSVRDFFDYLSSHIVSEIDS